MVPVFKNVGEKSVARNYHPVILVSDGTVGGFNRSGTTRTVALDISKAFDRALHAVRLHKLKFYEISGIHSLYHPFLKRGKVK